jgi:pimeloyl-ACP methyl ester carboxylesterase
MAVLDLGDPARPVDLVFVHANGFNAATYTSLLAPLAQTLRIWAPDLRGHGRTRLPTETSGRRGWQDHRDDLIALLDAVEGPPVVLAGHSMGGTAALLAAAERPERVRGLVLLDPVIWSRAATLAFNTPLLRRLPARSPLVTGTLRRRARFDSREAAHAAYRGRGAFRGWPDVVLADYLSDGLIEADSGFALACTPQWEASNYACHAHDPWRALRRLDRPAHITRAETGALCRLDADPPGLPHVKVRTAPAGHLFPMTHPDLARAALSAPLR